MTRKDKIKKGSNPLDNPRTIEKLLDVYKPISDAEILASQRKPTEVPKAKVK